MKNSVIISVLAASTVQAYILQPQVVQRHENQLLEKRQALASLTNAKGELPIIDLKNNQAKSCYKAPERFQIHLEQLLNALSFSLNQKSPVLVVSSLDTARIRFQAPIVLLLSPARRV
jgi:hypothetical protein